MNANYIIVNIQQRRIYYLYVQFGMFNNVLFEFGLGHTLKMVLIAAVRVEEGNRTSWCSVSIM